MTNQDMADRTFLALTIYREARGEPRDGKIGVAMTMKNRVSRPSWWGKDVQGVLFKKWQYSSLTDPKDRQLTVWPVANDPIWQECLTIACDALDDKLNNPVPGADSYFDTSIPPPKWTETARFVKRIGRLVFFDVDHDFEVI